MFKMKKSRLRELIVEEYNKINESDMSDTDLDRLLNMGTQGRGSEVMAHQVYQDLEEYVNLVRDEEVRQGKSPEEALRTAQEEMLFVINKLNKFVKGEN